MTVPHDLRLHIDALRQRLSQASTPIGFFLGAGCAVSVQVSDETGGKHPLIPDIRGMTDKVRSLLQTNEELAACFERLERHFSSWVWPPNVEDYLGRIRALRQVAGDDEVQGLGKTELERLEGAVCDEIYRLTKPDLPGGDTPYHNLARWIRTISRDVAVEIFTTNYDLLMEQALERLRVPYFDGFVGSCAPFFDPHAIEEDHLPSRWARIWKLHGSINWALMSRDGESDIVCRRRPEEVKPRGRQLIHPSHLKYDESRRMPYLAMIDRLKHFLKRPSAALVVCGYSFADVHLNEVLRQGLSANPRAHAFGLLYSGVTDRPASLAEDCSNLTLLSRDEAVIGSRRAPYQARRTHGDSVALEKDKLTPEGSTEPSDPNGCALGDFNRLGDLLRDLNGSTYPLLEEA